MGLFDSLKRGLSKTRNRFLGSLEALFGAYDEVDDDFFDEVSYLPIHAFKKKLINKNDLSGNHIKLLSFRRRMHSLIHTRFPKPLWITNLEYLEPLTYEGYMNNDEGDKLRVKVVFENAKDLRYFFLYVWDEYEEAFIDFLYDSKLQSLVLEEEPGLRPSVRYRRYKMMFDTDYVFYGSVEEHIEKDQAE